MKCLKESLARLANRQHNARGAFFEERFESRHPRRGIAAGHVRVR